MAGVNRTRPPATQAQGRPNRGVANTTVANANRMPSPQWTNWAQTPLSNTRAQRYHISTSSGLAAGFAAGSSARRCSTRKRLADSNWHDSVAVVVGGARASSSEPAETAAAAANTAASSQRRGRGQDNSPVGSQGSAGRRNPSGTGSLIRSHTIPISTSPQQQPSIVSAPKQRQIEQPASPSNSRTTPTTISPKAILKAAIANRSPSATPIRRSNGRPSPKAAIHRATKARMEISGQDMGLQNRQPMARTTLHQATIISQPASSQAFQPTIGAAMRQVRWRRQQRGRQEAMDAFEGRRAARLFRWSDKSDHRDGFPAGAIRWAAR